MGKFDNILICTDLDGTILRNDGTISEQNLETIEYFKREGGYFTFITGRMPFYAADIYNIIHPNTPVGCVNGGGLYDYVAQKYIYTIDLPREAIELVRDVDREYPNVGIQVNTFDKTYFCKENDTMFNFRAVTGLPNLVGDYENISETLSKIIFGSELDDEILGVERVLRSHPMAQRFDFIRSERSLFEILPKGVGKGISITRLAEYLGIGIERTVAIGDYNNDISMFEAAGIGIAVENASPEAKAAADFITVSNEEHAIARVIHDIEGNIYKF